MALTAKEIEVIVTKDFFRKHFETEIMEQDIVLSEHPDVHVSFNGKFFGIEVGTVVEQRALTSANQEKRFFESLNQAAINCEIREDVLVSLVMQDDKDTVVHKAAKGFEHFKHLPKYIEGIFVYPVATQPVQPIILNQSSSSRTIQDLFPGNMKTIAGIAADIANYVSKLQDSDFVKSEDLRTYHRAVTADMAGRKSHSGGFKPIPESIVKKIIGIKDYRDSRFDAIIILLHNFIDPMNPGWRDAMHVYLHCLDQIIDDIRKIIRPEFCDAAYFVDYSKRVGEVEVHEILVKRLILC